MDLRRILLSLSLALATHPAVAAVRAYPLDDRTIYTIHVATHAPTTCVFPEKLTALEGADIGQKPEDGAAVLLSYQPGARFFTVRASRDHATAALNVVLREKIYVLVFVSDTEPDRAVTFLDEPLTGAILRRQPPSSAEVAALVERARQHGRIALQFPALVSAVAHATPNSVTRYRDFEVTIEEVFRFEPEDVLVFRLALKNPGDAAVHYDPEKLAIRVGTELFPAVFSDASGAIPPRTETRTCIAIGGSPLGGRANLSVTEKFSVVVPHRP